VQKKSLLACHERIKPFIHNTPVLTSSAINEMVGAELFFKCENFQKMGAYKMRGATNAIIQLTDKQKKAGVVTHSSGNFAQALSLAAKSLGVPAYIVMPESAPKVKKIAVEGYGGHIIECPSTLVDRENNAQKIVAEKGATFIHPSNDTAVILGQGTASLELLQSYPELNSIITPVGGGGLIAGSALSAFHFGNNCTVIGAEPFEADDAYRSMQSGKIETNVTTNTIADGLKTVLGDKNFPIIQEHVDRIIRVSEDEIVTAMRIIWERMKIIIEPSSAIALAAILREREAFAQLKIGVIISGGNVDLENLPF